MADQDMKEEMAKVEVIHDELEEAAKIELASKPMDPRYELAIRMYHTGAGSQAEVASRCKISLSHFNSILRSDQGQLIANRVKAELDTEFQALYKKVITVLNGGLESADDNIAIAAANLWLRTNKGNKVIYGVTTEDVLSIG